MLFYLVLAYIVVFYSQPGARVPALESLRIEFILGTVILVGIWLTRPTQPTDTPAGSRLNGAIVCLFLAMVLSMPGSHWLGRSIQTIVVVLKGFALYVMIVSTVDTERKLKQFVWVYLSMVLLIVGEPFLGMFLGTAHYDSHRGYDKLMGETGLWAHPNSLGGFAAGNLAFLYYLFRGETSWVRRTVILGIAVASLGTIIFTGSRTAYVGVVGVAIAIWLISRGKMWNLLLATVILAVTWFAAPQVYKDQFLTIKQADQVVMGEESRPRDSMAERWEIIEDAWVIFWENPILGVGVDAFSTARGAKFDRWQDTHNLYLQVLTNLGILGGIAFAMVIYHMIRNLRMAKSALKDVRGEESQWLHMLGSGIVVFVAARLIVGMFGMDLYENYWWLAGGLSVVTLRLSLAEEEAKEPVETIGDERRSSPESVVPAPLMGSRTIS